MALTVPFTGGCACGAIRYESSAAPVFGGICCCRTCQRGSGTGQNAVVGVPNAAFRITQGEPRYYETTADSGKPVRHAFCGTCGAPLFGQPSSAPLTGISAGSLDDPAGFEPGVVVYAEAALPWVALPDIPKFPKMPPAM
jgi:hypothetical protein